MDGAVPNQRKRTAILVRKKAEVYAKAVTNRRVTASQDMFFGKPTVSACQEGRIACVAAVSPVGAVPSVGRIAVVAWHTVRTTASVCL